MARDFVGDLLGSTLEQEVKPVSGVSNGKDFVGKLLSQNQTPAPTKPVTGSQTRDFVGELLSESPAIPSRVKSFNDRRFKQFAPATGQNQTGDSSPPDAALPEQALREGGGSVSSTDMGYGAGVAPRPVSVAPGAQQAPLKEGILANLGDSVQKQMTEDTYVGQQAMSLATQVIDFFPAMLRSTRSNAYRSMQKMFGKKAADTIRKVANFTPGAAIFGKAGDMDKILDASGNIRADARQWLMESAYKQGGGTGMVTAGLVDAVEQTLMNLQLFRALKIGYGGKVVGATKKMQSFNAVRSALVRAGLMTATSEQESLGQAAKSFGISVLYQSTPAVSGWMSTNLGAVTADILANATISTAQLPEVIENAQKQATAEGRPDKGAMYVTMALVQMYGSDVVFGAMTRSFNSKTPPAVRKAVEKASNQTRIVVDALKESDAILQAGRAKEAELTMAEEMAREGRAPTGELPDIGEQLRAQATDVRTDAASQREIDQLQGGTGAALAAKRVVGANKPTATPLPPKPTTLKSFDELDAGMVDGRTQEQVPQGARPDATLREDQAGPAQGQVPQSGRQGADVERSATAEGQRVGEGEAVAGKVDKPVEQMTRSEYIENRAKTEDVFGRKDILAEEHAFSIRQAIIDGKPVLASEADYYGEKVPENWTRKGDLYVPPPQGKVDATPTPKPATPVSEMSPTAPQKQTSKIESTKIDVRADKFVSDYKNAGSKFNRQDLVKNTKNAGELVISLAERGKIRASMNQSGLSADAIPEYTVSGDRFPIKPVKNVPAHKAAAVSTSTDKTRKVLNGILHDAENNVIVATDGQRIVVIPSKVNGKTRIIAAHDIKGDERIAMGKTIDGTFPNWKQVIPDYDNKSNPRGPIVDIDATRRQASVTEQLNKSVNYDVFNITARASDGDLILNPQFVREALESLVSTGAKTVRIYTGKSLDPVMFVGENGAKVVIMPKKRGVSSVRSDVKLVADQVEQLSPPKPTSSMTTPELRNGGQLNAETSVSRLAAMSEVKPKTPDGYVMSKKRPDGKWQLFWTGTRNEVFPGEMFASSKEARDTFKAVRASLPKPVAEMSSPELRARATELGIEFNQRTTNKGLRDRIDAKQEESAPTGLALASRLTPEQTTARTSHMPTEEERAAKGGYIRLSKDAEETSQANKVAAQTVVKPEEHRELGAKFDNSIRDFDGKQNLALEQAKQAELRRRKLLPKDSWEKIALWLTYRDRPDVVKKYYNKVPKRVQRLIDGMEKLTADEKAQGELLRKEWDEWRDIMQQEGSAVITEQEYVTQVTRKLGEAAGSGGKSGFAQRSQFEKQRKFRDGPLEVWASKTHEPVTMNAAQLMRVYQESAIRARTEKNFVENLKGLVSSDGTKLLVPADELPKADSKNYKLLDHPAFKVTRPRKIHRTSRSYQEERGIDYEMFAKGPAKTETSPVRKYLAEEMMWTEIPLMVHKSAYNRLRNILKSSSMRDAPVLRELLQMNAFGKYSLLSFSGFHHVALAKTGAAYGAINHRKGLRLLAANDPDVIGTVERGNMTLGGSSKIRFIREVANEGLSAVARAGETWGTIPRNLLAPIRGIAKTIQPVKNAWDRGLWDSYYVGLKALSAKLEVARNKTRYAKDLASGKMNMDDIYRITANDLNNNFGGLNWRVMKGPGGQGVPEETLDAMRLGLLAPDWTLSNWRFFADAVKVTTAWKGLSKKQQLPIFDEKGDVTGWRDAKINTQKGSTRYMAKVIGVIGGMTAIANYAFNKRLLPTDEEKAYMIELPNNMFFDEWGRAFYFDAFGHFFEPVRALKDPFSWANGKKSFILGMMQEAIQGKNWRGDWIGGKDEMESWLPGGDPARLYRSKYKDRPGAYERFIPTVSHSAGRMLPIPVRAVSELALGEKTPSEAASVGAGVPIKRGKAFAWVKDEKERRKILVKHGKRIKELTERYKDDPDGFEAEIEKIKMKVLSLKKKGETATISAYATNSDSSQYSRTSDESSFSSFSK